MKVYLVGGAVRDKLLGKPIKDRDWVVTQSTFDAMLEQGYRSVGKDFPVFLHPESHEEYALARIERKIGAGYHGFEFDTSAGVTLEEDLSRRDLTINAMAEDEHGQLIDPYNGKQDLDARLLRHVSAAFAEDPVRILRAARFAARYHHDGFTVAPETMQLMTDMVNQGEVDALVAERVWQETESALKEASPEVFFQVLRECGALKVLFPEIEALFGVPQNAKHHPEIDTGVHALLVLQQAVLLSDDVAVRFAALMHDLGKGTTPADSLPSHPNHEERGVKLVEQLCRRLKVPNRCKELAVLVTRYHGYIHQAFELKPQSMIKVLKGCDAYRRPERFEQLLLACEADAKGRTGFEECTYKQASHFSAAFALCRQVDVSHIIQQGFTGQAIQVELHRQRIEQLKSFRLE